MSQHSLSISSSDLEHARRARWTFRPLLGIIAWASVGLAAIDTFIGLAFPYPDDPKTMPSRLQSFFEYGRSAEGSLQRRTRADRSQTAPITLSGWYQPLIASQPSGAAGKPAVTIYGGSHSVRLAHALVRVTDDLTWRSVAAPGASSNWSYGAFLRDKDGRKGSVAVVLTFNTNLLPAITSFSPTMWNNDNPMPYTGDRFVVRDGELKVIHPPYDSFEEYQRTLTNPAAWSRAVDFFARNDPLFDSISFRSNLLDHSALARLARRAYNTDRHKKIEHAVLDPVKFNEDSEAVQLARAIILKFAADVRAEGRIPIVFLVNDLGYSDVLFRAVEPALRASNVPYISSHQFISPNDVNGYLPDGHFTDANDDRLGKALDDLVRSQTAITLDKTRR
ncbi:hypothetical protein [Novosphingobium sp. Gsoil 351]|uniref:hypothetical protein n=1 Tax=Novosphingobium sp. Gsoil 351 TaxID=2675225 RepID=UPI0012B4A9D7|nr:hypothetical protein [Novosphingobium sp. Gsoil 351]QGN56142.1 hypothetical protein GKE62_17910 [Novosphingobium sp. Gsoil 351]